MTVGGLRTCWRLGCPAKIQRHACYCTRCQRAIPLHILANFNIAKRAKDWGALRRLAEEIQSNLGPLTPEKT